MSTLEPANAASLAKFVRIAARIAGVRVATAPRGESFDLTRHVTQFQVSHSKLPDDLKTEFVNTLAKKERVQELFVKYARSLRDSDLKQLEYAQKGLVHSLQSLMRIAENNMIRWVLRFDAALTRIERFDPALVYESDLWHVDIWVQHVHELVTALFLACGGRTGDEVPTELWQPEWGDQGPAEVTEADFS
jgi:hypothetical protein